MEDHLELVGAIANGIVTEPALASVDWKEATIVFSFEQDGFCNGHFGYAYDAAGYATPFTVDSWQIEEDAGAYRIWLQDNKHDPIRQMLFQFNRDNGRYNADFHYDAVPRWQVTPANLDEIVPGLRPRLAL